MASTDFKNWYAKVKYYNGDVEDILVRKIKTQEGNQFSPKDYKDFNANVLYSVKTAMNDIEGKEQRYYAWIGRLAGSVEELNDTNKRISWPAWPSDILDEPDNTSQDERQQVIASSSILAHREKAAQRKSKKRAIADEYEKFLYNNSMEKNSVHEISDFSEQITTDSSGHASKRCSQNQEKLSVNRNKSKTASVVLGELSNLHEKVVQKIEEKLEKRSQMMEEKIIEIVKQQVSQAYEKTIFKIEEVMGKFYSLKHFRVNVQYVTEWVNNSRNKSEFIQSLLEKICCKGDKYSTSSVMSSETENKVHLGSGFYCTQAGFTAMETAKNDCDWTVALLVGVFGEDAKLKRVYPRKPGLKKFPLGFLMQAQNLYRQRLKDGDYEGNIDEAVKSLPAYLSDRALDLGGGRSIVSRAKHFKKSKNNNYISQRKEAIAISLTSKSPLNVKKKKLQHTVPVENI